ncbi:MAG TPA: dihydropteroate synthase [Gammaproteobacteria bacterium]|nr:dihydropteroate synthase [Gammaproteobacteria bacterium]
MAALLYKLNCKGKILDLGQPKVMGILNITPDSFSDGGDFLSPQAAVERAKQMVEEGAAIIDVGGESTRPGAPAVSVQEELDRIVPVIEALSAELPVPISIDTSKPEVMRAAVAAGAGMINDVRALRLTGALEAAADINRRLSVPICLMHMQGEPGTMQQQPDYSDVVQEVCAFLAERVQACVRHGIPRERLVVDPGFGFGKQLEHNLSLLKRLDELGKLGLPIMVGLSRKSMIGVVLDRPVTQRLYGSLAAAVLAVARGAVLVRVHDVRATVEALKLYTAVLQS